MLMTHDKLNRCAANLARVMRAQGMLDAQAVAECNGEAYDAGEAGEEYVDVSKHPGRKGFVIGYRRRTGQAPIMLIVMPGQYLKLMVTCTDPLAGYVVFDEETEFGLMQDRAFPPDLAVALEELDRLAKIGKSDPDHPARIH